MEHRENLIDRMAHIQLDSHEQISFDEAQLLAELKDRAEQKSLVIKVFSVFGGLLASFPFLLALYALGLLESELGQLLFGLTCILSALILTKKTKTIVVDSLCITLYFVGFISTSIGLYGFNLGESLSIAVVLGLAIICLLYLYHYLLAFFTVLIINACIIALFNLNHLQTITLIYSLILLVLAIITTQKEAKFLLVNKQFSLLYNPIKNAIQLSYLICLICILYFPNDRIPDYLFYINSAINTIAIIYIIKPALNQLNIYSITQKYLSLILLALVCLPTFKDPLITGTILITLLNFKVNYKLGFIFGVISFLVAIALYYYNLNTSLLLKSIALMSTGLFFIFMYLITFKFYGNNTKI